MKTAFRFLLYGWLLGLGACASLSSNFGARAIEAGQPVELAEGEILVAGRIRFIENGRSKLPYGMSPPMWQLESSGNGQPSRVLPFLRTREDGRFLYAIPAGHYRMAHVEPFYYTPMINPALEFSGPTPGHTYYLGELVVDIDATSWLGGLWGNYITHLNFLEVQNDPGSAPRLPANVPALESALLTRIPGEIPALFTNAGGVLGSIRLHR